MYTGVITKFINAIKNDQPVTIFGDGSQTRDFIHVKDVVQICLQAMLYEQPFSGMSINVGTGIPTTICNLHKLLKDVLNKDNEVLYRDTNLYDINHSYSDNTLLCKLFEKDFTKYSLYEKLKNDINSLYAKV
jgi:UDP-glucose 4-epimerase